MENLCYEVCRWIGDNEPHYSNEIISCGKRGQVIRTCDTLEEAQAVHAKLATQGTSFMSLYFINGVPSAFHLTDNEKREWERFACALFEAGHAIDAQWLRSIISRGTVDQTKIFDRIASAYRAWLVFNEYPKGLI